MQRTVILFNYLMFKYNPPRPPPLFFSKRTQVTPLLRIRHFVYIPEVELGSIADRTQASLVQPDARIVTMVSINIISNET